jgi:hypothetical protein
VSTWQDKVAEAASAKMQYISANRERYVEAWFAETGLKPSESELVEHHHADGTVTVTVRARTIPDVETG